MKKLIIYLVVALSLTGCEKFLEKTPSEGGIESFNDAAQFDALLNDIRVTRNRFEWNHAILGSDDLHFHPDFQTANPSAYQQREAFNIWNENELKNLTGPTNGFNGPFAYMYTFNYIVDRIDGPSIGGSDLLKKQ